MGWADFEPSWCNTFYCSLAGRNIGSRLILNVVQIPTDECNSANLAIGRKFTMLRLIFLCRKKSVKKTSLSSTQKRTDFSSAGSVSQETLSSFGESFQNGFCAPSAGEAAICNIWQTSRGFFSFAWFRDCACNGLTSTEVRRRSNNCPKLL